MVSYTVDHMPVRIKPDDRYIMRYEVENWRSKFTGLRGYFLSLKSPVNKKTSVNRFGDYTSVRKTIRVCRSQIYYQSTLPAQLCSESVSLPLSRIRAFSLSLSLSLFVRQIF